jgi:DeoR/GlpR family transcriptional regulator of sugar metabolism
MAQEAAIIGRNAAERRRQLLQLLEERGQLTVREIGQALTVSEVTVRQDLMALEKEGALQRTWGGAALPVPGRKEGTFASRLEIQKFEKQAIAAAAVELIEDGDTLLLDASTTAYAIAQRIKDLKKDLYIITNGLYTALELGNNPTLTVVSLGGIVRGDTGSLVGTLGEEVLARLYAGKGFFSARGLNLQQGLSESNIQEAQLKALMIRHTKQVIAVVDSTKLGQTSFSSFCPFNRIDHLITAGDGAQERALPFVENGLAISIV